MTHTEALVLAGLFGFACLGTPPHASAPSISCQDGDVLSGELECAEFVVPAGSNVFFDGDLSLRTSGDVVLIGNLVALEGAGDEELDAPDLSIQCGGTLYLDGSARIQGANGVSTVGLPADGAPVQPGRGSSLRITARHLELNGELVAGRGGHAGPGAEGGLGGDLLLSGEATCFGSVAHTHGPGDPHGRIHGGAGGNGGDGYDFYEEGTFVRRCDAGDGGWHGRLEVDIRYEHGGLDAAVAGGSQSEAITGPGQSSCTQGLDRSVGVDVVGASGADGGAGANGTEQNPAGGNGGDGSPGQPATSAPGASGGDAGSCCWPLPAPGKRGGRGQTTGSASGGQGGKGGNAYGSGEPPVFAGPGGDGGDGGKGGDATSGKAGDGGRGSDGCGPGQGGDPGAAGSARHLLVGDQQQGVRLGRREKVEMSVGNPAAGASVQLEREGAGGLVRGARQGFAR